MSDTTLQPVVADLIRNPEGRGAWRPSFPRRRESIGKCNLRYLQSAPDIAVPMSFAKVSIKGEGDLVGWCCLVVAPPCGYCIKASTTARSTAPLDCGPSPQ